MLAESPRFAECKIFVITEYLPVTVFVHIPTLVPVTVYNILPKTYDLLFSN